MILIGYAELGAMPTYLEPFAYSFLKGKADKLAADYPEIARLKDSYFWFMMGKECGADMIPEGSPPETIID